MTPPWLLLLSPAGVAVCVSWIPTVSAVASVPNVAVAFYLSSVATASMLLSASIIMWFPLGFPPIMFCLVALVLCMPDGCCLLQVRLV